MVSAQMEILKAMHRRGVQVCFLVHDLLPVKMPALFPPGTDVAHADWLKIFRILMEWSVCPRRLLMNLSCGWVGTERILNPLFRAMVS